MEKAALVVNRCCVDIRKERILTDIDFQVNQGEILALVGHNGAGKSTLIKAMIGAREKASGTCKIGDYDQDKQYKEYKRSFTNIPEEPVLFSELTVFHHFKLYQKSYNIEEGLFNERVEYYTGAFELTDKMNSFPESLSKGMRQKVQTICALLPDVPIIFIDEPFMGLDVYAGATLEQVLKDKRREGVGFVLTTHQLEKLSTLADQYVMLSNGKVSSKGTVSDFTQLDRRFT
ncbi:ABC-2 type transport system ATP-binding protein [Halobacillus dabanensis]|uniref:ABC-2 type transport system ATP-binding protein n=1 Tax=Halobacillus dabanensis TaxID=240302 RepID=A0A1I4ADA6_HALDA|nr:ABC transporter ATP-binding protein [Halobacillus dabanensis]SFK54293.1 ABC-2 type transport system ATP-binding protein [Halobacillus dabanensis]